MAHESREGEDEPKCDCRNEGSSECKGQDDSKVAEKVLLRHEKIESVTFCDSGALVATYLLELVSGIQDDRWEEYVQEDGALERYHVLHDIAR